MAHSRSGVVELTFEVRDLDYVFIDVSSEEQCTIRGERAVQRSDETMLEYFSVSGSSPADVLAATRTHSSTRSVRIVHEGDDETLIEVHLDDICLSRTLADAGAVLRSAVAVNGVATVIADVPDCVDPAAVADQFCTKHPAAEITAKRGVDDRIPGLPDDDRQAMLERLTEKQRQVLETALLSGYFAWPRRRSAEECAAALGISQPTFSQHLRSAQQTLVESLFAEPATFSPNEYRQGA